MSVWGAERVVTLLHAILSIISYASLSAVRVVMGQGSYEFDGECSRLIQVSCVCVNRL